MGKILNLLGFVIAVVNASRGQHNAFFDQRSKLIEGPRITFRLILINKPDPLPLTFIHCFIKMTSLKVKY